MLHNKQKPNTVRKQSNVKAEVAWAESGYTYPERSGANPTEVRESAKVETGVRIKNNIMVAPEVSRGHSKPATSSGKPGRSYKGRRTEC